MSLWQGVIVPIVTPFDTHGNVDQKALLALVDMLVEAGVHGFFVCGSTGEAPLLSVDERKQVAQWVLERAGDKATVVIQTGAITLSQALDLTLHARDLGAHGAGILSPFYFRYTQEDLALYYRTILSQVGDFPIYLYNYPDVATNALSIPLIRSLLEEFPNIVGIKDSSGDLSFLKELLAIEKQPFRVAVGSDAVLLPAWAMGCQAYVTGNGNVIPEFFVAWWQILQRQDVEKARAFQQRLDAYRAYVSRGHDFAWYKGLLRARGLPMEPISRQPCPEPDMKEIEGAWTVIRRELIEWAQAQL